MKKEMVYRALAEIAKREGIEVEEVIAYIDAAISEAVKKAHECNDVDTIAKWRSIPGAGDMPTAVELISYLGDAVMYIS